MPYETLDIPLQEIKSTQNTASSLGLLPAGTEEIIENLAEEYKDTAYIKVVSAGQENIAVFYIVHCNRCGCV